MARISMGCASRLTAWFWSLGARAVEAVIWRNTSSGGHSHRFAGGHATPRQSNRKLEQFSAVESITKDKLKLYIALGPRRMEGSSPLQVDVTIVNHGVGHRFPGGARDLRDTWIEIEFLGPQGTLGREFWSRLSTRCN